MKKLIFASVFSLFLTFFCSCEAEKVLLTKSKIIEKSNSEISFTEFQKETGLTKFKTEIKVPLSKSELSRNADGSYELSDFDIDTDVIKRLELIENVTYSFRIYPKIVTTPSSFYNLTMSYINGEWIQNVVELKPDLSNFDDLLSGSSNNIAGNVSFLYTSNENVLNETNNCYTVGIIGDNCPNAEISDECLIKKYSTFCFDDENNITNGIETSINNDNNNEQIDYSFLLNTNNLKENLTNFAEQHVRLNNQILKLLESENNINFDNFPYNSLSNSQNEVEFKHALENSGVVRYSELGDLILSQSRNAANFQSKNTDFQLLKPETKQELISNAIQVALQDNPVDWIQENPSEIAARRTCHEQYIVDRDRCNRNNNANGALAILAFTGGPVAGGLACLAVMIVSNNCLNDARDDYNDCRS